VWQIGWLHSFVFDVAEVTWGGGGRGKKLPSGPCAGSVVRGCISSAEAERAELAHGAAVRRRRCGPANVDVRRHDGHALFGVKRKEVLSLEYGLHALGHPIQVGERVSGFTLMDELNRLEPLLVGVIEGCATGCSVIGAGAAAPLIDFRRGKVAIGCRLTLVQK
jgi:hypothetical protein